MSVLLLQCCWTCLCLCLPLQRKITTFHFFLRRLDHPMQKWRAPSSQQQTPSGLALDMTSMDLINNIRKELNTFVGGTSVVETENGSTSLTSDAQTSFRPSSPDSVSSSSTGSNDSDDDEAVPPPTAADRAETARIAAALRNEKKALLATDGTVNPTGGSTETKKNSNPPRVLSKLKYLN